MAHFPADHVTLWDATFTDTAGDARCEITFAIHSSDDSVPNNAPGFAIVFNNAVTAHLAPVSPNDVLWTGCIYEDIRTVPYGGAQFPMAPVAGGVATGTTAMPNSNAIAIRRQSTALYRSGRGRVFFPIWAQSYMASQNLYTAGPINNIVTGLGAFQLALETAATFVVEVGHVSFQTGKVPNNPGIFHRTVSWSYTDLTPDVQRRRLPGRGR